MRGMAVRSVSVAVRSVSVLAHKGYAGHGLAQVLGIELGGSPGAPVVGRSRPHELAVGPEPEDRSEADADVQRQELGQLVVLQVQYVGVERNHGVLDQ